MAPVCCFPDASKLIPLQPMALLLMLCTHNNNKLLTFSSCYYTTPHQNTATFRSEPDLLQATLHKSVQQLASALLLSPTL